MTAGLLNCLIKAESLTQAVAASQLESYANEVEAWRSVVESVIVQLPRPLSDTEAAAISQLIKQSDVMSDNLNELKQQLHKEHQSLLKGNTAANAYAAAFS